MSHGLIVDASETGDVTASEGVSQASPDRGDSTRLQRRARRLTRLAALQRDQTRRILRPT